MSTNEENMEQAAQAGLAAAQAVLQTSKSHVRMWAAGLATDLARHHPTSRKDFEQMVLRLVRFYETGSFDPDNSSSGDAP